MKCPGDQPGGDGANVGSCSIAGLLSGIWRHFRHYQRRWFQRRNIVFIHRGPYTPGSFPAWRVARYEHFEDLPDSLRQTIILHGGDRALTKDRLELEQNGIMWAAHIDDQWAGALFTRQGRHFKQWFVPLADDDIVIFRVRTYPAFRGRGIAPTLMRQAMHLLLQPGRHAYVDCRVYNQPSIRCIEKAGFSRIATMKPISREQALG